MNPGPNNNRTLQVALPWIPAAARAAFQRVDDAQSSEEQQEAECDEDDGNELESSDGDHSHRRKRTRRGYRARKTPGKPEGLAIRAADSLNRFMESVPDLLDDIRDWMSHSRPRISSLAEVKILLPRLPLSERWTDHDRALVERDWNQFLDREKMLDVRGNKDILTLYRTCLRLMRCLPDDIISCRYDLEYDANQNRAISEGHRRLIWSAPFCRSLTRLLVHPLWGGSAHLLAIAIRYVAMADTGDDGPWNNNVLASNGFLSRLFAAKRQNPGQKLSEIRSELRQEGRDSNDFLGESSHDLWDLLFEAVEKAVAADGKLSRQLL